MTIDLGRTVRGVNWLKDTDLLPKEIPSARVLSFSYDSEWLARTDSRFWDLGAELMREIHSEREDVGDHRDLINP